MDTKACLFAHFLPYFICNKCQHWFCNLFATHPCLTLFPPSPSAQAAAVTTSDWQLPGPQGKAGLHCMEITLMQEATRPSAMACRSQMCLCGPHPGLTPNSWANKQHVIRGCNSRRFYFQTSMMSNCLLDKKTKQPTTYRAFPLIMPSTRLSTKFFNHKCTIHWLNCNDVRAGLVAFLLWNYFFLWFAIQVLLGSPGKETTPHKEI